MKSKIIKNAQMKKYRDAIIKHWDEYAWWDEYASETFDGYENWDESDDILYHAHFGEDDEGNIIITNLNVETCWNDYWQMHNVVACFNKFGCLLWISAAENKDYDF